MTGVALQISRGKNRYSRHVTGGNVISKRGEKKKKTKKIGSQLYSIYEKQFQVD